MYLPMNNTGLLELYNKKHHHKVEHAHEHGHHGKHQKEPDYLQMLKAKVA